MRATFQEELEGLQRNLQEQADYVLRALHGSLEAIRTDDPGLAREVIGWDRDIDDRFAAIEEAVQVLLARQTPVATDLRLVLASLHVNLSLERIADYAVTISKLERLVAGEGGDAQLLGLIERMGLRAEEMIRVAVDSFAARDLDRARSLDDLDELVDRCNREVSRGVLDLADRTELRPWALQMLVVARCLERIGDHAVDIGEQTAFLVTGELRRISSATDGPPTTGDIG